VVDAVARRLCDREVPATASGYRRLVVWVAMFGQVERVGVEGTGTAERGILSRVVFVRRR
jgi:hypothetical protein